MDRTGPKPLPPRIRVWTPYLLPNLLTSLNLLAGFYAVTQVLNHSYGKAVWAILLAAVFDGLDGMAARLTKGSSAFGLEFDSLADLISFGMAPAIFLYLWQLHRYGRIGWVAAFLFLACGALRLARFNVQAADVQKHRFLGIPIPMAASQVVNTYLILNHTQLDPRTQGILVLATAYLTAFLMISSIQFRSLKSFNVRKENSFAIPVLLILLMAAILSMPHVMLWICSTLYILSGPAEAVYHRFAGLGRKKTSLPADTTPDTGKRPER
jgi:CDP-diacylglycerol--serine O-phosphatidyltransferase